MKAIVYTEYGTPDMLSLQEVPTPTPGEGEVLVRVRATSINDWDWLLLNGKPFINRIGGLRRPKHHVLGSDVAGVVESVGTGVTRLSPGDEVFGDMSSSGFGAFAEYVAAPEASFARKPAMLTWEQAGVLPQAAGLAVTGMLARRPVEAGQRVLVNGAGGGVGSIAIQIAKTAGAEVTGVDLPAKLDAVRAWGADHVIDYTREDFGANGQTYDRILDVACHRSMASYRRSLNPGGVCALIGGSIPRILQVMAVGPVVSAFDSRKVRVPMWKANKPSDVAFLTDLIESGSVVPAIDSTYPLEGIPDAFRHYGAQLHCGKVAITV
jgi:NADPH:quinone reductase-like Zn-dependent oxidoreductase